MGRALQLATFGGSRVSPNPFVGAVIVYDDRIIGEGYHRAFGGPHAEVNAVKAVTDNDKPLLKQSTIYVSLEPCSHFGKTPPCANLIVESEIPKVVIAAEDPFLKDRQSGIDILRQAGIEVKVGVMEKEAVFLNRRFFTAHTLHRPYILLKWAQSADGFIAGKNGTPIAISSPITKVLMHKERSLYDAIMTGVDTVIIDNPHLDCRLWPARRPDERPLKVGFLSSRLPTHSHFINAKPILKDPGETICSFLNRLYADHGITSLMIEGGRKTIESFIAEGIVDEVRIETALDLRITDGIPAPDIINAITAIGLNALPPQPFGRNVIQTYCKAPSNYKY